VSATEAEAVRAVCRWHFYAGLLVIPILVMLSLTGIVYLFKPQIDSRLMGSVWTGGTDRSTVVTARARCGLQR
jgi:uncharacterized iron-regulated membrane protein